MKPLEFAPSVRSLLEAVDGGVRLMPLVPTGPLECPQLDGLRSMATEELFEGGTIASRDDALCVHSGLYLYFSALDESHRISQRIKTSSGSYWHGIMHRQEGDWSNSKYWFRRTGEHPVFAALGRETQTPWDPFAFVDRCAASSPTGSGPSELAEVQRLEWRLLMQHCYRLALGR